MCVWKWVGRTPQATPVTKIIQRLLCVHIMRFKLIHDGVEHRTSSVLGEPLNLGAQGLPSESCECSRCPTLQIVLNVQVSSREKERLRKL